MEEILIKVKNKEKVGFIKELLSHISFVEIVDNKQSNNKAAIVLSDVDEAVAFVKSYKKGSTKVKSMKDLLDEL